jgi:PST family polysaccharide transporter
LLPVFAIPMPVLAFFLVAAREVILVLLGAQWLEVVPLFQVLIIAAFVGSMSMVTKWLYLSQGHTKRQLQWGLVSTPVLVAAVTIGTWWGTLGVAVGFTVGTCLLAYPSIAFCLKTSHLRMRDFVGVVWRPALASIVAAAMLLVSRSVLPDGGNPWVGLPLKLTAFGLVYLLVWLSLPGGWRASTDVIRLVVALQTRI